MSFTSSSYSLTPYKDNDGFFINGYSSGNSMLCRYTFSTSIAEWQVISNVEFNLSQLMISQNQFILVGGSLANRNIQIYKLTFSSTSVDWANKVVCTSGSWFIGPSVMTLSSDASTIYTFYLFGGGMFSQYIFFTSFSVSTGSIIGSIYKSSISDYEINSLTLNNDYLICETPQMVIIYKISTSTFQIKNAPNFYYGSSFDQSSGQ